MVSLTRKIRQSVVVRPGENIFVVIVCVMGKMVLVMNITM